MDLQAAPQYFKSIVFQCCYCDLAMPVKKKHAAFSKNVGFFFPIIQYGIYRLSSTKAMRQIFIINIDQYSFYFSESMT